MKRICLPERQQSVVFMLCMSLLMVCLMSGLQVYLTGGSTAFWSRWGLRVMVMWPLVAVLIIVLAPLVRRFIHYFFEFRVDCKSNRASL